MIIRDAKEKEGKEEGGDNSGDEDGNGGTMIVDATCALSNIRYPQDISLLNDQGERGEAVGCSPCLI